LGMTLNKLEKIRKANKSLIWKPDERKPLWRHYYRWEDDVKVNVNEKCVRMQTRFSCLRLGSEVSLLWMLV
jgi:hypothetical protein